MPKGHIHRQRSVKTLFKFQVNYISIFWPYGHFRLFSSAVWSKFLAVQLLFIRPLGFGLPGKTYFLAGPPIRVSVLGGPSGVILIIM